MITRLLVANRGEIACRISATARAMGIGVVAVYAEPDAGARHVAAADVAVPLRGTTAAETYLRIEGLIAAAQATGADAVHPGYGFLAENADFARAVVAAGLTWVGPPPEAIAAMGDKLSAKRLMAGAGVPTLPSTPDPAAAEDIGYPLIVKAAAGGGGKGMRVVTGPGGLEEAVAAARREAAAAFGDDRVFLERYLDRPRHIEVQVLADGHGRVVHLGERECSLQRRHQKVIEEAPSPAVDDASRARLGRAAVDAATAIGYVGAGTVEFVSSATPDGIEFFFLEVNTRLQVEHPVTEEVWRSAQDPAALDLVRLQLLVAEGQPLPFAQQDLHPVGHAVEARLYAEDPSAGFLPVTGTVELLEPAHLPGTRWDSGVGSGDVVSPWYDPMIAKVIAHAPTRTEAVRLLAAELRTTRLHGLTTNRDALVGMLTHPDFVAGDIDTGFIGRMAADDLAPPPDPATVRVHGIAVALLALQRAAAASPVQVGIPVAWRNNRSQPHQVRLACGGEELVVALTPTRSRTTWTAGCDGHEGPAVVHGVVGETIDLEVEGRRLRVTATALTDDPDGTTSWGVDSPLGATRLVQLPRFPRPPEEEVPGGLTAPMPGTVVSVAAAAGAEVVRGDLLLVLEAMKMEHRITAPHAGRVAELRVDVGQQVDAGDVLAVIDAADGPGADQPGPQDS